MELQDVDSNTAGQRRQARQLGCNIDSEAREVEVVPAAQRDIGRKDVLDALAEDNP